MHVCVSLSPSVCVTYLFISMKVHSKYKPSALFIVWIYIHWAIYRPMPNLYAPLCDFERFYKQHTHIHTINRSNHALHHNNIEGKSKSEVRGSTFAIANNDENHLPSKFDFDLCLMLNWLSYAKHLTRVPNSHFYACSHTYTHSYWLNLPLHFYSVTNFLLLLSFFIGSFEFYQRTNKT